VREGVGANVGGAQLVRHLDVTRIVEDFHRN
jgi:hypothetical protein